MCVRMQSISTRKILMCKSSEGSRESARSRKSVHAALVDFCLYMRGIFDEISSFIAYAQSIAYLVACMHEYLVRLEVFIFAAIL